MAFNVYTGISFPWRKDKRTLPASAQDADLIRQDLMQLVMTGRKERVMRPGLGTSAIHLVFANADPLMAEMLRQDLLQTIGQYEPRVIVREISISVVEISGLNTVRVTIRYVIVATRRTDFLTIDFPVAS